MKVIHLNRSSKATRWLDVKQQLWWSPGQCSSCRGAEVPVLASGACWQRSGPACGSDQKFFPGNSCCQKAATKAAFAGLSVWRPLVKQLAQTWLDSHFAQSHCTGIYCDCHVFTQYQHLACINYWQSEYVIVIRGGRLFFRQDVAPCNINTNLQGSLFTF